MSHLKVSHRLICHPISPASLYLPSIPSLQMSWSLSGVPGVHISQLGQGQHYSLKSTICFDNTVQLFCLVELSLNIVVKSDTPTGAEMLYPQHRRCINLKCEKSGAKLGNHVLASCRIYTLHRGI